MAIDKSKLHPESQSIHVGTGAWRTSGARNMPIYQSACYHFDDSQHGGDLFGLEKEGFIYARINNPTLAALEHRLAAMEGGIGALVASSGLAAEFLAFLPLMSPGDNFVSSRKIYGGSGSLFANTFKKFGWKCNFVQPEDSENFKKDIDDKTKAIFVESVSNPAGIIPDFEAVARIAEDAGIPFIVDNTVPTPALFNPFKYGANIITHSLTKNISGHSTSMGGAIIDGGTFNWEQNDKFPYISQPDESYAGMVFSKKFGPKAYIMNCLASAMRDIGAAMSPANAFYIMTGMETLTLRMQKHVANTQKVAEFLDNHDMVDWVSYSGLPNHVSHKNAQKYMTSGTGCVFTFGMKQKDLAQKVVENCEIFRIMAHIGDTGSLIIHPATTTHRQLPEEDKIKADCGPEVIRLSVGIEHPDDLINDLSRAIEKAAKG